MGKCWGLPTPATLPEFDSVAHSVNIATTNFSNFRKYYHIGNSKSVYAVGITHIPQKLGFLSTTLPYLTTVVGITALARLSHSDGRKAPTFLFFQGKTQDGSGVGRFRVKREEKETRDTVWRRETPLCTNIHQVRKRVWEATTNDNNSRYSTVKGGAFPLCRIIHISRVLWDAYRVPRMTLISLSSNFFASKIYKYTKVLRHDFRELIAPVKAKHTPYRYMHRSEDSAVC